LTLQLINDSNGLDCTKQPTKDGVAKMYSKIYKTPGSPPTKESLGNQVSGKFFQGKLTAWCEVEPMVLIWEVTLVDMPLRVGHDIKGNEIELDGGWMIEFQFARSSTIGSDKLFDGVSIIAGFIKRSYEMTDKGVTESYYLSLNSRNLRGEAYYSNPQDLWVALTTLGIRKKS
jgi:hypothetical protein